MRHELLKQADVHTLLRLPTGIFYVRGVKANVVFFERKPAQEKPWTNKVWIYVAVHLDPHGRPAAPGARVARPLDHQHDHALRAPGSWGWSCSHPMFPQHERLSQDVSRVCRKMPPTGDSGSSRVNEPASPPDKLATPLAAQPEAGILFPHKRTAGRFGDVPRKCRCGHHRMASR